jgi:hypothetical protein
MLLFYESTAHSKERIVNKGDSACKASCLATLTPKMPDLAAVVEAWTKRPERLQKVAVKIEPLQILPTVIRPSFQRL